MTTRDLASVPMSRRIPGLEFLPVGLAEIRAFCREWKVVRLAVYGESAHSKHLAAGQPLHCIVEFREQPDIGVVHHGLMEEALSELLGIPVRAVTWNVVDNQWDAARRAVTREALHVPLG